jgi:hypothetical protein
VRRRQLRQQHATCWRTPRLMRGVGLIKMDLLPRYVMQGPPQIRAGRLALSLGILAVVAAGGAFLAQAVVGSPQPVRPMHAPLDLFDLSPSQRSAAIVGQSIEGLLLVLTGVGLLRSRPWARAAALVQCGLGIVWIAGYLVMWCSRWFSSTSQPRPAWVHLFAAIGALMLVCFLGLLAWCTRYVYRRVTPRIVPNGA